MSSMARLRLPVSVSRPPPATRTFSQRANAVRRIASTANSAADNPFLSASSSRFIEVPFGPRHPRHMSGAAGSSDSPRECASGEHPPHINLAHLTHLEGEGLPKHFRIMWEQWGDPNAPAERTLLILPSFSHGCHAASNPGNTKPGWWEFMIGPGEFLDTNKYRVICTSFLGSPHGATSCESEDPTRSTPGNKVVYGPNFPQITPGDMARGHAKLLAHLGIERVHAVVGGSMGAMQAVGFMALYPEKAARAIVISGTARTSPYSSAVRLVQRRTIMSDLNFHGGLYNSPMIKGPGPIEGMKLARMIGMTWYRSRQEFDRRFEWGKSSSSEESDDPSRIAMFPGAPPTFEVEAYLRHQADKFSTSFDANCYLGLSKAMDLWDLGASADDIVPGFKEAAKPGETVEQRLARALRRVTAKVQVIGVAQDVLIPISEQQELYEILQKEGKDVFFVHVNDEHGHDAMFNEKACKRSFAPYISSFIEAKDEDLVQLKDYKMKKEMVSDSPTDIGSFARTVLGNQAAKAVYELPFHLPYERWLKNIGNTPIADLGSGLYAKLEGMNPGGSVKDRAMTALILKYFVTGKLKPQGSTLVVVTSGWAGLSLATFHEELSAAGDISLDLIIVMPKAYAEKEIPAKIYNRQNVVNYDGGFDQFFNDGNKKVGGCHAVYEDGLFIDVLAKTHDLAKHKKWVLVDQHHDVVGCEAHASTALEIMCQLPGLTDIVAATGTGATAAGLRAYLPSKIRVHSRPTVSGTIDGLTDVNRYNNFCDSSTLEGYNSGEVLDLDMAREHARKLADEHSITAGPSSGACFYLAQRIKNDDPDAVVAFISADGRPTELAQSDLKFLEMSGMFQSQRIKADQSMSTELIASLSRRAGAGSNNIPLAEVDVEEISAANMPQPIRLTGTTLGQQFDQRRAVSASSRGLASLAPSHLAQRASSALVGQTRGMAGRSAAGARFGTAHSRRSFSSSGAAAEYVDHIVIGGGPVGTGTALKLGERQYEVEEDEMDSVMLIHNPANMGAHGDWSRLARLSFDGPEDELELSRHAVALLQEVDEVRSYQSGAPVIPVSPGMLFLASPGTPMARACTHAEENYGDDTFKRVHPSELGDLYPGNACNLPEETLCWSHPTGLCISPIELCTAQLKSAEAYGVRIEEGIARLDVDDDSGLVTITLDNGKVFQTKRAYLMAGAQSKQILAESVARDAVRNADLKVDELDDLYITAISTVRYKHRHHPSAPAAGSGHVVTPITLGQLEIPDLIDFQANFSIVAEEYGDVLKTRLSGAIGSEVIPTVADLHRDFGEEKDAEMAKIYQNFFGPLFPYLETDKPQDFNRCVTYRNHIGAFSGTSLLEKQVGNTKLLVTPGCFGVGVKFGPALGEAAAAHVYGDELHTGMNVFQSGDPALHDEDADKIERAW